MRGFGWTVALVCCVTAGCRAADAPAQKAVKPFPEAEDVEVGALMSSVPRMKEKLPANDQKAHCWKVAPTPQSKASFLLLLPKGYKPEASYPLVVELHGGGSGPAEAWAAFYMALNAKYLGDRPMIVIVPMAREHQARTWHMASNLTDVLDAIQRTCETVKIDRRRIYLTGHSLGAGGTYQLAFLAPELFAAFAPQSCVEKIAVPETDLTGRGFLIFLPGAPPSKEHLEALRKHGAEAEGKGFPHGEHLLPQDEVRPAIYEFFAKRTNPTEPDFAKARKAISSLKE